MAEHHKYEARTASVRALVFAPRMMANLKVQAFCGLVTTRFHYRTPRCWKNAVFPVNLHDILLHSSVFFKF